MRTSPQCRVIILTSLQTCKFARPVRETEIRGRKNRAGIRRISDPVDDVAWRSGIERPYNIHCAPCEAGTECRQEHFVALLQLMFKLIQTQRN